MTVQTQGGFDADDLALISKFPLVTMEKWQGDQGEQHQKASITVDRFKAVTVADHPL